MVNLENLYFYGKDSLRKKNYTLTYEVELLKVEVYNVEVYDADKNVSLAQDRIEFEKVPESYIMLDSRDAERPANWYDLRRGKKVEYFPRIKEYAFLVSYLSKEVQQHPPNTIRFDIPAKHYEQDD